MSGSWCEQPEHAHDDLRQADHADCEMPPFQARRGPTRWSRPHRQQQRQELAHLLPV